MAQTTLSDLNKQLKKNNDVLVKVEKSSTKMSASLSSFVESLNDFKGKDLEKEREARTQSQSNLPGNTSGAGGGSGFGMLDGLLGAAFAFLRGPMIAVIAGLGGAILASFDETMNDVARSFITFGTRLGEKSRALTSDFLKSFGPEGRIGKLFRVDKLIGEEGKFTAIINKAVTGAKNSILISLGLLGEDGKQIAITKKGTQGAFNPLTKFNERLKALFGPESRLGKAATALKEAFTFTEESKVFKIIQGLGTVLKKIFVPIGIIFTAYDTIKGMMEGYERDGIITGLIGGVAGFFASIVGAPLNLIKSATSWMFEQFGWSKASKWMDENLDFEQAIKDIGQFIMDLVIGLKDKVGSIFGDSEPTNPADYTSQQRLAVGYGLDPDSFSRAELNSRVGGVREMGSFFKGTLGATGKLFNNFGKGTPAMLHGEEAVIPKNSGIGSFLGKMMKAGGPMMKFANEKGGELQAKEAAMRAAGASDMDIAQSMMGDMGGMMAGLKGAVSAGGLDKLKAPKMDMGGVKEMFSPNNMASMMGGMIANNQQAKQAQAQPAPVVINNSSNTSTGSSSSTMIMQGYSYDDQDPIVRGYREGRWA